MEKEHLKQGATVGHLHIQNRFRKKKTYYYHCQCDCGAEVDVEASRLERRLQTSCRCKGVYLEVGKTYGHLTIKKRLKRGLYEAECSCGNIIQVNTYEILHGDRTSCGCGNLPYRRKTRKDNQTGVRGVSINHRTGRFIAYIRIQGKNRYLGSYSTIHEATAVRKDAEYQLQQTGTYQARNNQ